jgi:hypothetical protein
MALENQKNIVWVWVHASRLERDTGRMYYFELQAKCGFIALAARHKYPDLTLSRVAAMVAVLSPNDVEENTLRNARIILGLQNGEFTAYPANVEKARRILHKGSIQETLSGPKVTAFFRSICNPLNDSDVVVDGHMVSVWYGKRLLLRRREGVDKERTVESVLKNVKDYRRISADFLTASRILRVPPPELQAVTWLTWRRIQGIRSLDGQMNLELFAGANTE